MSTITQQADGGKCLTALLLVPLTLLPWIDLGLPAWLWMWLIAFAIYSCAKWLTWRVSNRRQVSRQSQAAYILAWPGMDAAAFLHERPDRRPAAREWLFALAKFTVGGALYWGCARLDSGGNELLQGWVGLAGLVLMLHFGIFHLLSCFWRSRGRLARPLMNWPVLASSVADFWGRRWNRAFRDLTHRFLFQPLSKQMGPRGATLVGFGVSGLVHELVISVPAGGGYGWPTLYFMAQGGALLVERSAWGRGVSLGRGLAGRLFALIVVAAPVVFLFHPPFVRHVVVPFMRATGAL